MNSRTTPVLGFVPSRVRCRPKRFVRWRCFYRRKVRRPPRAGRPGLELMPAAVCWIGIARPGMLTSASVGVDLLGLQCWPIMLAVELQRAEDLLVAACYLRHTPDQKQTRGLALGSTTGVALVFPDGAALTCRRQ